jgi:hypothetical protein
MGRGWREAKVVVSSREAWKRQNPSPRPQMQRLIIKNNNNMDISNTAVDYYNIKRTLCNNSDENPRW